MTGKRVLILTLSFGTGHVMASSAIAEAARDIHPQSEVRIMDCIEAGTAWFRAAYVWPYWMMLRFAPFLWARLFEARQKRQHQQTAPPWLFRWGCWRVFRVIRQWQPEVIVATEVGACEIAVLAKKRRWTRAPIVAVATDHESEPVWVKRDVDRYCVPTPAAAEQLIRWGARRERIVMTGIPVSKRFHSQASAEAMKRRLGLPTDRPMVLVMGGGMGPLRMDQIVRELASSLRPTVSIVVITGLNERMRRRVNKMRSTISPDNSVAVHGWVENVNEWMQAADVLVTKPGGLSLTEAATVGLPMVCVNPIPGPEENHCRFIEREGLGVVARSMEEVSAKVKTLLAARATATSRPTPAWLKRDAAEQIARLAIGNGLFAARGADAAASGSAERCGVAVI